MRPTFLLSKGERKETEGLILPDDILLHYSEVYASRFIWEGAPKDMPRGFIEKALFWTGGVGPVRAFGEENLVAAYPVMLGIYAQPITWEPVPAGGSIIPPQLMRQYKQSKDPILRCFPMAEQIRELCVLMADAYNCLKQTLFSMGQPVAIQGMVGGEVNVIESKDALLGRKLVVPTLDKTGIQASVIDLGGKDHTQNLISTINALDCEILARFGIKSAGTEKASGVTSEETLSITQELQLVNKFDYDLRVEWSELPQIRERFPSLKVKPSPSLGLMLDDGYTDEESRVRGEGDDGDPDREGGPASQGHEDDGEEA